MSDTAGQVWLGLLLSVFTTVLFGLELAFSVYAVDLKPMFNFTHTGAELVSVSGVAGMGASLIEPFVTSRFGYKIGYLLIWTTTAGSALILWVAVVFTSVIQNWRSVVCLVQFLMNASQNASSIRLTTTIIQCFPERYSGRIIGLGLASIAGGNLFSGGLIPVFFLQDFQGFFLAVVVCQAVSFGIVLLKHRPKSEGCSDESLVDSRETLPFKSSLTKTDDRRILFGSNKISNHSDKIALDLKQVLGLSAAKISSNLENATRHSQKLSADLEKILCSHDKTAFVKEKIVCPPEEISADSRKDQGSTDQIALNQHRSPPDQEECGRHEMENTLRCMIRSSYFHLTFWPSAVVYSILFTYMNNIKSVAYSVGLDEPRSAVYLLSLTIFIGRFTFGLLCDRFKSSACGIVLLLAGSLSTIVAITLTLLQPGNINLYIISLLLGVGMSVGLIIPASLLTVRFGHQNLAYIIGCLYCFTALFSLLFQFLIGILYDESLGRDGFCYGSVCFFVSSIVLLIPLAISMVVHFINYIINSQV